MTHPLTRSALYCPASRPRVLGKAAGLPADMIILDLEDAVAPESKATARVGVQEALTGLNFGPRQRIVRINGLATPWGLEDIAMLRQVPCDGVALPKVDDPGMVAACAERLPELRIWAMIETPKGVLQAAAIAAHTQVAGLIMGTNDLAKALRAQGRGALQMALQSCVLAARAADKLVMDGVYNAFEDAAGLRAECAEGRALGFDGKTVIHPAQLAICNAAFGPNAEDIALAQRRIAAFGAALAAGQGVAVVDGEIVEQLHVDAARVILAQAEAIAERENA